MPKGKCTHEFTPIDYLVLIDVLHCIKEKHHKCVGGCCVVTVMLISGNLLQEKKTEEERIKVTVTKA